MCIPASPPVIPQNLGTGGTIEMYIDVYKYCTCANHMYP